MNIVYKKTSELIPYARNNKIHSERQIKLIASSIQEFGFKQPIVIDSNNTIIIGHARTQAAELLKLKEVPCIIADDLTDVQMRSLRIADNKLADLGEYDQEMLALEVAELGEFGIEAESLGFDIEEITRLNNVIEGSLEDFDIDDFEEEEKEKEGETLECPKCGFQWLK